MPETRLIDANALQRAFDDAHKDKPDYYCCNFLNNAGNPSTEWDCVDDILENAPTIDAQPVKHGHWIEVRKHRDADGCIVTDYKCSECGIMLRDTNPDDRDSEFYCYHCGAKMDGGDADETE